MTKASLKTVADLINERLVPESERTSLQAVAQRYAISIPPHLRQHIQLDGAGGPLARQFVPDARELQKRPEDVADPIGDEAHSFVKGIVHRYRNRVLLKIVHVCPVYCRFCFRREMVGPGSDAMLTDLEIANALTYVARHPEIEEVIMTGGDPLVLSPRRIADLTRAISDIPHVTKLRWHSRVPIAAPERVTRDLVMALAATKKQIRLAVHINHACELTRDARRSCQHLRDAGIELLSQTVLLRGVNDAVGTLTQLFEAFRKVQISPYYLHQLDLAPGTHHFRVPIRDGQALLTRIHQRTPTVAQPRYMLDIPGGFGKVPLVESHVHLVSKCNDCDVYRIRDPFGRVHIYRDFKPEAAGC